MECVGDGRIDELEGVRGEERVRRGPFTYDQAGRIVGTQGRPGNGVQIAINLKRIAVDGNGRTSGDGTHIVYLESEGVCAHGGDAGVHVSARNHGELDEDIVVMD